MLRPSKVRLILISLFILTLAVASTLVTRRTSAQSPTTVTAQSIQRWSITNGNYQLTTLSDGTLVASGEGAAVRLRPGDGSIVGPVTVPDIRFAVLPADPGTNRPDYLIGGYQDKHAYKGNGDSPAAWDWILLGCCNIGRIPMAIDPLNKRAFESSHDVVFILDALTGQELSRVGLGQGGGYTSVADSDTVYAAGGPVGRVTLSTGEHWNTVVPGMDAMRPGAVTSDGGLAVSGGAGLTPGRLAVVRPNGALAWNLDVQAVTPPVIGGGGLVLVGTQASVNDNGFGAIEAYDPSDGQKVWSTPVEGLPIDLLVGDDGAVYAGTGSFTRGSVYALDQATGQLRRTITNVPGAQGIILSGGLLFASGESITALPVEAVNYDPASPWPVRFHDNLRTASRTTTHYNPPRQPAPAPSPSVCPQTIPGLIAYWPADGNAQDAQAHYSGINVNNVPYVPGVRGQAFHFTADVNQVRVLNSVYPPEGGTVELWFNWDGTGAEYAQGISLSWAGGNHVSPGFVIYGTLHAGYSDGGGPTSVQVTPGQWYHAAITYDANHHAKTYVNGALINEFTASDPAPFLDETAIGRCVNCTFPGFNGSVDEMRVYNRPLSASEIQASYNGISSSGCPAAPPATPTPTPAPTPPFQINIDPGSYIGHYTIQGFNQDRPSTLTLMPGRYIFDNQSAGRFTFDVDASGGIVNISSLASAHANGNTLVLHNAEIIVDPQNYTGIYFPYSHVNLPPYQGEDLHRHSNGSSG